MADGPNPYHTLGRRIRRARFDSGLNQRDGATRCGYSSRAHYNKIEVGRHVPKLSQLFRIARAYGTTASELLRGLHDVVG